MLSDTGEMPKHFLCHNPFKKDFFRHYNPKYLTNDIAVVTIGGKFDLGLQNVAKISLMHRGTQPKCNFKERAKTQKT